jgi:hypothetical protein
VTAWRHRPHSWGLFLVYVILICTPPARGADERFTSREELLVGRFVAWINGPRLTSFGVNYESYLFEVAGPFGPHIVTLSYSFALFESQIPKAVLDYSQIYFVQATHNPSCDDTLADMAETYIFNSQQEFVAINFPISYVKNAPSAILPWKTVLPCYSVLPGGVWQPLLK